MSRINGIAAEVLISVGILALTLAAVLSVARRALLYPDAFADRLASSLADPRVASFVADRLTGAVIREDPDLTAFRPFILATARGAVSSTSFQALVRTTARPAPAATVSVSWVPHLSRRRFARSTSSWSRTRTKCSSS